MNLSPAWFTQQATDHPGLHRDCLKKHKNKSQSSIQGWRRVKSICWSCKEPAFTSQHPHGGSVCNFSSKPPTPPSGFPEHCMHMVQTVMHTNVIYKKITTTGNSRNHTPSTVLHGSGTECTHQQGHTPYTHKHTYTGTIKMAEQVTASVPTTVA